MLRKILMTMGVMALALGGGAPHPAAALENNDRVTIVVPYSPGGGFDTQARLIAPYLEAALRSRGLSDVDVIVTNVRGGGGAIATSQVYAATPDGTTLLVLDPESTLWQQTLSETVFDLGEFTYLAQVSADPFTLSMRKNMEIADFPAAIERSQTTPILVATSGHGAIDHILPLIVQKVLEDNGTKLALDFLHFGGTSDKLASMRRDEAEMTAASTTAIQGFVSDGLVNIVLTFAESGEAAESGAQARKILGLPEQDYDRLAAGAHQRRVIVAPPGMDDETRDVLRGALDEVLNNQELIAKAEGAQQVVTFLPGSDVGEAIGRELDLAKLYGEYVSANVER